MIIQRILLPVLRMSMIACIGSLLSIVNLIPLLIAYQLMQKAKQ